jgi:AcrR family transcriptional regulator
LQKGLNQNKSNKRSLQAKKTKAVIMNKAIILFGRQGYHKTTIQDICRYARVSTGAFFGHFSSKRNLLLEVVDALEAEIKLSFEGLVLDETRPIGFEKLEQMFLMMIDSFAKIDKSIICFASLSMEFAGSKTRMEERIKDLFVVPVEIFYRLTKHHPNVKDPEAVAIALTGAAQGCAIQSFFRKKEEMDFNRLMKGLLSILGQW